VVTVCRVHGNGVAVARGEGFGLQDIGTEVLIWHGGRDRNDPVAMARLQERQLPHAKAVYYYPEDGHLIFYSRIEEILPELIAPEGSVRQRAGE
jgi:fermentation-respiration switch protein FrsA (DUF1100 family)